MTNNKKKMVKGEDEIYQLSWKISKLMRQRMRNDELNDLLNMTVSELLNEVEKSPNLKDVFSWHDLFELFNAPISLDVQKELFKINNKQKLEKYVKKISLRINSRVKEFLLINEKTAKNSF